MDTIESYYELSWTEVDTEAINNQLTDFQNRCRKLPKALKEWQAFNDLSKLGFEIFSLLCVSFLLSKVSNILNPGRGVFFSKSSQHFGQPRALKKYERSLLNITFLQLKN
jgi:hypothetical protein